MRFSINAVADQNQGIAGWCFAFPDDRPDAIDVRQCDKATSEVRSKPVIARMVVERGFREMMAVMTMIFR